MKLKLITGALLILLATAQAAEQPANICQQDEQTQQDTEDHIKKQCAQADNQAQCERQAKAFYDALVVIHCTRTPKERK